MEEDDDPISSTAHGGISAALGRVSEHGDREVVGTGDGEGISEVVEGKRVELHTSGWKVVEWTRLASVEVESAHKDEDWLAVAVAVGGWRSQRTRNAASVLAEGSAEWA